MKEDDMNEEPMSALGAIARRSIALCYDLLLLLAVWFTVTALALVLNDGEAIVHPLFRFAVLFGVSWLFFDWFWRHGGQTLGMNAWRLQLVDDGDGSLTRRRTLLRYALGTLLFGITFATIPFDPRRRAMHDRLTRTRVLRVAKG